MLDATKNRIEEIKNTATITGISFANEELGDEGAKLLSEACAGRKITTLSLTGSKISTEGLKLFEPLLKDNANLTVLSLDINPLPLEILSSVTSLRTLTLTSGLNVSNMEAFIELINRNNNLTHITLVDNKMTAGDIQSFAAALRNRGGQYLNLALKSSGLTLNDVKPLLLPLNNKKSVLNIDQETYRYDSLKNAIASFEIIKHQQEQDQQIQNLIAENAQLKNELATLHNSMKDSSEAQRIQLAELRTKLNETERTIKTGTEFLNDMLFNAAQTGNAKLMQSALDMGADIKAMNPDGMTALHISTLGNHVETTNLLLEKEPQLFFITDKIGLTPIQKLAATNGRLSELGSLYEQGKKISGFSSNEDEFQNICDTATPEALQ